MRKAVLFAMLVVAVLPSFNMGAQKRSYSAGRFALTLDGGESVGYLKSVKGLPGKSSGSTPITMEIGMGMGKGMIDWVNLSFKSKHVPKTGVIHACNAKYESMATRELINMHITEIKFPSLDGSSKDPCYMTIKITPERIRYKQGDRSVVSGEVGDKHKDWLAANFRVEVGGLPAKRVTKVESFSIKQKVLRTRSGPRRTAARHPAKLEIPNLKLTISAADIGPWQKWHRSFVIDGKCAPRSELTGSITFLDPSMTKELGRLDIGGVCVRSIRPMRKTKKKAPAQFIAELSVGKMRLKASASSRGRRR